MTDQAPSTPGAPPSAQRTETAPAAEPATTGEVLALLVIPLTVVLVFVVCLVHILPG